MSYRKVEIGRMVRLAPSQAVALLRRELASTGGNLHWTAEHLGVDVATLRRWVAKLNHDGKLRAAIETMRATWTKRRRRPVGFQQAQAESVVKGE